MTKFEGIKMELMKDTNTSTNNQQSQALSQLIEFSWKATRGLVEETETHVSQLVGRLVDAGKITAEDRSKLSTLLGQRMADSRKNFLQTIDAHVKTAVEKITALSTSEVQQLEKDISALEQKVSRL
jgi:polyhydroxyalkanoate synthesis regulator phasin